MPIQQIDLKIQTISMDLSAADRLIRMGSGEAALLYLYLLRCQGQYDPVQAAAALRWSRGQLDTALAQLQELGLAAGFRPPVEDTPLPKPEEAPDYSAGDLAAALSDPRGDFSQLILSVESLTGRKLTNSQVSILLQLYDHVDLPVDVLYTMICWIYRNSQEKFGAAAKLSMTQVRATGYRWKEQGLDTIEAAEEHIERCRQRKTQEGAMLSAMGVYGRKPTPSESRYIKQWLDWSFSPEAVARAMDIAVVSIGKADLRYINGILARWHKDGLHSLPEIEAAQKRQSPQASQAQQRSYQRKGQVPQKSLEQQEQENRRELLEMQRMLALMDQEE